jgi:hypothetical protein
MNIVMRNGQIILSRPETLSEQIFMETVHTLVQQVGPKIEFEVSSMAFDGRATHVGLRPIIPEEFTVEEMGDSVFVDRKYAGCACGEDH